MLWTFTDDNNTFWDLKGYNQFLLKLMVDVTEKKTFKLDWNNLKRKAKKKKTNSAGNSV